MPDGRVIVDAHIARVGVQEYELPDGTIRRELRTRAEVFAPKAMSSFEQVPVTRLHPSTAVTADNATIHMVGASGERVVPDDDHVRTQLMVADKTTINDMDRYPGVSCGYFCDLVHTPGVDPEFGAYDAIQTNIRGNHIAVAVPNPRAGKTARVRMDAVRATARAMHMDGDVGVCWDMTNRSAAQPSQPPRKKMADKDKKKLTVDEQIKIAEDAAAKLVGEADVKVKLAEKKADDATSKLEAETIRADKAEGALEIANKEVETLKAKLDDAEDTDGLTETIEKLKGEVAREKDRADSAEAAVEAKVNRRAYVMQNAAMFIGAKAVTMDATDRELMVSALEQAEGVTIDEKKSDAYVEAMFDRLVATFTTKEDGHARLREAARATSKEREKQDARSSESARDKYTEAQRSRADRAQKEALKRKGVIAG